MNHSMRDALSEHFRGNGRTATSYGSRLLSCFSSFTNVGVVLSACLNGGLCSLGCFDCLGEGGNPRRSHSVGMNLIQVVGECGEKRREILTLHSHHVGETGEIWTGDDVVEFIECMSGRAGLSSANSVMRAMMCA